MAHNKPPQLFNYYSPTQATRTLNALREAFPNNTFDVVISPLPAYQFRYLVLVKRWDGMTGYAQKTKLNSIDMRLQLSC
jgi:hypothetical protein